MILTFLARTSTRSLVLVDAWSALLHKPRRGHASFEPLYFTNTRSGRIRGLSVSAVDLADDEQSSAESFGTDAFQVQAPFPPAGDQPAAIKALIERVQQGDRFALLRGCTGTGKTLVMSHVIAGTQKPTLVLCHNKTLAAQLARELRAFLGPVVELFVSYYNHYRPEFFRETTGTYMAKKSSVNPDLDVLRHRATRALASRRNVVVVASVSCLFGLGLPKEYLDACVQYKTHDILDWDDFLEKLTRLQYRMAEDDESFERGKYQILHDDSSGSKVVTLWPPYEKFPMQLDVTPAAADAMLYSIRNIRQGSQDGFQAMSECKLFPASHHVTQDMEAACLSIEEELQERINYFNDMGNTDARNRLQVSVLRDLDQLRTWHSCKGIENYSRHLADRPAGLPPDTLLDYMRLLNGEDWLLMMDESHVTLPQLSSMFRGDQSRKLQLVKHGYRLPSALDNRPLNENEFWDRASQTVFVSATPSHRELALTNSDPIDMIIRPTYVCDPKIEVRSSDGKHIDDLIEEVKARAMDKQGSLVITLTKRDAEDLASHLEECGVKSAYLHSGLKTLERSNALRALQLREIDCIVGINCLREGLDLPQVSLVAVLNADCEGFLRSESALLQVVGRAARNVHGKAIFYANRVTDSMKRCMDLTAHRRQLQLDYNLKNGCSTRSTTGSSALSFFDLLKEQIEFEKELMAEESKAVQLINTTPEPFQVISAQKGKSQIVTDHIPNTPGVYFWKDVEGSILYIGKGVNLRSRVKSYILPSAKHGPRIKEMVRRAKSVDVVLTASERDALLLESNYIKHHQPPFNVLLKDDEHYPYICASVGDSIPSLTVVPYRQPEHSSGSSRYRYFGPYTSFQEINAILDEIERMYDLRVKSFMTRQGSFSRDAYNELFDKALEEIFGDSRGLSHKLRIRRRKYEEAGLLFESESNTCRDVVTVQLLQNDKALVSVMQLRNGIMAGRYKYTCQVPAGLGDDDLGSVIQTVLTERHYPSGGEHSTSWFPDNVLLSLPALDVKNLKESIREGRSRIEPNRKGSIKVRTAATRGAQKEIDERTLEFATKNMNQDVPNHVPEHTTSMTLNGDLASTELADLLALKNPPSRIECYDISHTQGENAVASRVVFENGEPQPHLYRQFVIRTVVGIDDYASIEEVLERRFRRAFKANTNLEEDDPWAVPDLVVIDGGKGQLNAALKGILKAAESLGDQVDVGSLVAICALAKDKEEVFVPGRSDPVNDHPDSRALLLLRALRDESHRFALKAHRKRRSVLKNV